MGQRIHLADLENLVEQAKAHVTSPERQRGVKLTPRWRSGLVEGVFADPSLALGAG
jgi:hypothetical protein